MVIIGPFQITLHRLGHHISVIAAHHCHMMFKAVLRHKAHQIAQTGHLCDRNAAIHRKGIIGKGPLPQIGLQRARPIIGPPWRMEPDEAKIERGAPLLGEHNDYVYGELLGLPPGDIADLKLRKVID